MSRDEIYMRRCLTLAELGKYYVSPNPMVGAVIVHNDKVIGEGYHKKYGDWHAEVNAIQSVKDTSLLKDSSIYVSLEPCSHYGNTPPCCELLLEHKFKRVIIGSKDPNKEVYGKGIQSLLDAGVEVKLDVLESECRALNKRFFSFHENQRPFISLKWAESADGFIDKNGERLSISCKETKPLVHHLRSENQGILVGRRTVQNDNPKLDVRAFDGPNPIRIVLDPNLKSPKKSNIFNKEAKTVIINLKEDKIKDNVQHVKIDDMRLENVLRVLSEMNITSLLVEGGRYTTQAFIDEGLWDEAIVIKSPIILEAGTAKPKLHNASLDKTQSFFTDSIEYYTRVC